VKNEKTKRSHRFKHLLDRLDRRARERKVVTHFVDVTTRSAEIRLHVDDHENSVLGAKVAVVRPGIRIRFDVTCVHTPVPSGHGLRRGRVADLTRNRHGYQCQNSAVHVFRSKPCKRRWGFPHGGECDFNRHAPHDDRGRAEIAAFDGFWQRQFRGTGLPWTQAGVIGARSAENSDSIVIKASFMCAGMKF
jgi:hypothetical protein